MCVCAVREGFRGNKYINLLCNKIYRKYVELFDRVGL